MFSSSNRALGWVRDEPDPKIQAKKNSACMLYTRHKNRRCIKTHHFGVPDKTIQMRKDNASNQVILYRMSVYKASFMQMSAFCNCIMKQLCVVLCKIRPVVPYQSYSKLISTWFVGTKLRNSIVNTKYLGLQCFAFSWSFSTQQLFGFAKTEDMG